jgi:hypothetical protein
MSSGLYEFNPSSHLLRREYLMNQYQRANDFTNGSNFLVAVHNASMRFALIRPSKEVCIVRHQHKPFPEQKAR